MPARTLSFEEGWIGGSHIDLRGERNILYKGVGTTSLPSRRVLKTLREISKGKTQKEQYLLMVGLGCYSDFD